MITSYLFFSKSCPAYSSAPDSSRHFSTTPTYIFLYPIMHCNGWRNQFNTWGLQFHVFHRVFSYFTGGWPATHHDNVQWLTTTCHWLPFYWFPMADQSAVLSNNFPWCGCASDCDWIQTRIPTCTYIHIIHRVLPPYSRGQNCCNVVRTWIVLLILSLSVWWQPRLLRDRLPLLRC